MTRAALATTARRDLTSTAYGHRVARRLGPLDARGVPAAWGTAETLRCDPGTGAGQCPRERIRTHRRTPPEPFGWEAGEEGRRADVAWWRAVGERHGGEAVPALDVDDALPARGAWEMPRVDP